MKHIVIITLFFFNIQLSYSQDKTKLKRNSKTYEVKAAAINALKWYYNKNGNKKYYTFRYLTGEEGDSLHPYRIDFNEAKLFFRYLLRTKIFSNKFTDDLLIYFKKCDSNFIAVKQYEKIPIGFESNLITKNIDEMDVEENINKSKISAFKKKGNTVYLSLKFANFIVYTFIMTKYNGKWLVDNINGDFPPLNSTPI
jgi:hypothetical protein